MRKRMLAFMLALVMLFSYDHQLFAMNSVELVNEIQDKKIGVEEGITKGSITDQNGVTVKSRSAQTEDQTGIGQCRIQFFDASGQPLGTAYVVNSGQTVSLNKIANYVVTGYEVNWKNRQDGKLLTDSQTVTVDLSLEAVLTPVNYQIHYNKNASNATGTMKNQAFVYGRASALAANTFNRKGYVFAGWALTPGGGRVFTNKETFDGIDYITKKNETLDLYAVWSTDNYTIQYELNKGKNNEKNPTTYNIESPNITLAAPTRKGYRFQGWFTEKSCTVKCDTIRAGSTGTKTFYAKWIINTYKIRYELNGGKNNSANVTNYRVTTADIKLKAPTRKGFTFKGWYTDSNFSKKITTIKKGSSQDLKLYAKWDMATYKITYKLNGGKNNTKNPKAYNKNTATFQLQEPTRSGYYFAGWYLDSKYNKKASEVKKGSVGDLILYAKWIREYKATASAANITTCKANKANEILIKATVKNRIASSDNRYYLVMVDAASGKILQEAARCGKKNSLKFTLNTKKNRGYALARYAIAVKNNDKFVRVSSVSSYITNPGKLAANTAEYKYGKTKKGLQTANIDQAIETGAKNVFLNINVSAILSTASTEPAYYTYNGKTYNFGALGGYLVQIKKANARGINVTMQINLDQATLNYDSSLIASEARTPGHLYYAWNTKDTAAREKMEAIFCYLSEVFGRKTCYVSNWILGNEIDSCNVWYYRGSMTDSQYVSSYAYAFRSLYNAAKSVKSSTKVYTCIDNIWNRKVYETNGMTAKNFLSMFSKKLEKIQSGVNWDISIHPYSVRIDYPEFWDGNSYYCRTDLVNGKTSTEFITMKNLSVFTEYVKKHYGNKSIIISEIGFDAAKSRNKQAAAIAYAYNIAACNKMIDAFIIRSYVDEPGDGGYKFGINGRRAYNIFKYMDSPMAETYTNPCLKTIGVKKWKVLISGYEAKKLYQNYRN